MFCNREVLTMKAHSPLSARFNISGLCVIAALAAGCTFDASQLRALPDGAVEPSAVPDAGAAGSGGDTASPPDAAIATGGNDGSAGPGGGMGGTSGVGGSDAFAATGGIVGSDGPSGTGGASMTDGPIATGGVDALDAPIATGDTRTGGAGGGQTGVGGTGDAGTVGGTARSDAGLGGTGGGGSGAGASSGAGGIGSSGGTPSQSTTPPPTNGLGVYVYPQVAISGGPGEIRLNLRIDNMTSQRVDMSTVTLRYWYQDEGLGTALVLDENYVSIGYSNQGTATCSAVTDPSPVAGADHYLQFAFTGTLAVRGDVSTNDHFSVEVTVHTASFKGTVDVTNDYSYNDGATGYDDKITLYQGGKLIWGTEP
jgi:hypothetical protein